MKVYFCKRKIFETSIVMKKNNRWTFSTFKPPSTYFCETKQFSAQNASFFSKSWTCGHQTLSKHTCFESFFVPKPKPAKSRGNDRRWCTKNQWKGLLLHTSNSKRFTLDQNIPQIFRSRKLSGMIWNVSNLSQNEQNYMFFVHLKSF